MHAFAGRELKCMQKQTMLISVSLIQFQSFVKVSHMI